MITPALPQPPELIGSYARQSQKDTEGIESQHVANREYAHRLGFEIPPSRDYRFSDNRVSGSRVPRPEYDRLKSVVAAGAPFRFIVCRNQDRFGRWDGDVKRMFAEQLWFEERGIRWIFTDDLAPRSAVSTDRNGNDGVLVLSDAVRAWMAGEEIRLFQQRTSQRRRTLALEGYWVTSHCPYATERWIVDGSATAYVRVCERDMPSHVKGYRTALRWCTDGSKDIVRQLYEGVVAGHSVRTLAQRLNDQQVPPPHQKAWTKRFGNCVRKWTASTVRNVLANPAYCGAIVYGVGRQEKNKNLRRRLVLGTATPCNDISGTGAMLVRHIIPDAPVTEELWLAVQRELTGESFGERPRKRASGFALIAGHVQCAHCHRSLWVQWNNHTPNIPAYLLHFHTTGSGRPKCPGSGTGLYVKDVDAIVSRAVAQVLDSSASLADLTLANVRAALATRVDEARLESTTPMALELAQVRARSHRLLGQLSDLDDKGFVYREAIEVLNSMNSRAAELECGLEHRTTILTRWKQAAGALEQYLKAPGALGKFFAIAPLAEQRQILRAISDPLIIDLHTGRIELRVRPFEHRDLRRDRMAVTDRWPQHGTIVCA